MRMKRQQPAIVMNHLIRSLQRVKRDSHGFQVFGPDSIPAKHDPTRMWFPPGLPVWSYDLVLLPSQSTYDTEYIRAKNAGDAKELIKAKYPNAERFDW
jgi:hypothetical protein